MDDQVNDSPADAEPTDSDLLQILAGSSPSPKAKAPKPDAADALDAAEGDEDLDDESLEDSPEAVGEDQPGDDAEADATPESAEATDDDDDAEPAADDDDPDASLDEEDKGVRAKFTPEQQARFDKALSKKTRRLLELKTELADEQRERERLAAELEEARKGGSTPALTPSADHPLADIDDEAKLDARLADARKLRRFALANPDGAFVDGKSGEVVELDDPENPPPGVVKFSKKRIGEILADTEETLQEHGPKHRAFLQARAAGEAAAVQQFPWLKNKNSTGYVAVESTLRQAPQLRSVPGIKVLLARAFIGAEVLRAQQQKQKPGAKGLKDPSAPAPRKAPPSPGRGAPPPKVDGKRKVAGNALKTVAETGDDPDDAALRALLRS